MPSTTATGVATAIRDAIDKFIRRAAKARLPAPAVRRHLRERHNITQEEMANLLGVTRPSFSRYESGKRSPRGDGAARYAEILDALAKAL